MAIIPILHLLKSNWKSIGVILIAATVGGLIVSTLYYRGYTAGYSASNESCVEKQLVVLREYQKLKTDIEFLSQEVSETASKQREELLKRTNLILGTVKGLKLHNPDCTPSKEFIGAWNALSNTSKPAP